MQTINLQIGSPLVARDGFQTLSAQVCDVSFNASGKPVEYTAVTENGQFITVTADGIQPAGSGAIGLSLPGESEKSDASKAAKIAADYLLSVPPEKITRATLKAFIARAGSSLLVRFEGGFDGMTDCVRQYDDAKFVPARLTSQDSRYTLGVAGVYVLPSSRNSFSLFRKDGVIGIHYYNCCGHGTVAVADADAK